MKLIALVSMQSAAESLQQHDPQKDRADRWIDFSRGHSVVKIRSS